MTFKTLLIRPQSLSFINKTKTTGNYPDLGLLYIAAYLERVGKEVEVIDLSLEKKPHDSLREKIKLYSPDVIGISSHTMQIPSAVECAEIIKEITNVPLILGGVHASSLPSQTLEKYPLFDIIVIGEGEETFLELVQKIETGSNYSKTKGIAYRKNKKIIITSPREPIKNLDSLPFPARYKTSIRKYIPDTGTFEKLPSTSILSSRGCPFNCNYCARVGSRTKQSHRVRSPRNIVDELKQCVEKHGIHQFWFVDDTFTIPKNRLMDICKLIIQDKLNISWKCYSRVDTIDREMLEIMKKSGCHQIKYGVETGTERMLKSLNKGTTLKHARKAVKLTKMAGIDVTCDFILGIPGETVGEMNQTIDFAVELSPKIAHFGRYIVMPGSDFFRYAVKKNLLMPRLLTKTQLDERFLHIMVSKAYRRFYIRPSYIIKTAITSLKPSGLRVLPFFLRAFLLAVSASKHQPKKQLPHTYNNVLAIKSGKTLCFEIKSWAKKPKLQKDQLSRFSEWCSNTQGHGFLAWYNQNQWRFLPLKDVETNQYNDENWIDLDAFLKIFI